MIAVEDLRNVLVESVNARDPELIEDVDLPDVADPSLVAEDPSGFTVAEWESDRARDRGER